MFVVETLKSWYNDYMMHVFHLQNAHCSYHAAGFSGSFDSPSSILTSNALKSTSFLFQKALYPRWTRRRRREWKPFYKVITSSLTRADGWLMLLPGFYMPRWDALYAAAITLRTSWWQQHQRITRLQINWLDVRRHLYISRHKKEAAIL